MKKKKVTHSQSDELRKYSKWWQQQQLNILSGKKVTKFDKRTSFEKILSNKGVKIALIFAYILSTILLILYVIR